jgi:hypothetical protein
MGLQLLAERHDQIKLHVGNRSLPKPSRWNRSSKFAIPAIAALPFPVVTNPKKPDDWGTNEIRKCFTSDWKFEFALRPGYLQDRLWNENAHIWAVPEKGRELASVNQGSRQVADMKGKRPTGTGARASERPLSEGTRPRRPTRPDASESDALGDTEVGNALRSVYQQTVDETIPPEMMDLLKKLT